MPKLRFLRIKIDGASVVNWGQKTVLVVATWRTGFESNGVQDLNQINVDSHQVGLIFGETFTN